MQPSFNFFSPRISQRAALMRSTVQVFVAAACVLVSHTALAQAVQAVQVENAWVRFTVPGQKATGAFMRLTSASTTRLVSVSTPAAGFAEVHEMRMENNVMKMSALKDGLELPAGKAVDLKPGGFHVMLMDLAQPLPTGSTIPMTLVFRDAKGVEQRTEIKVPVNSMAPMDHSH
jgi:copper(I)-binding protein